jgi:hypothetical protein
VKIPDNPPVTFNFFYDSLSSFPSLMASMWSGREEGMKPEEK